MKTTNTLSSRKSQAGITFVELCIVLAIVAILLGTGLPWLNQFKRQQQLKAVAETVATDIQQARSEAVRLRTPVQMRFSEYDSGSCYVIHTGASGACKCTGEGQAVCTAKGQLLKLEWVPKQASRPSIKSNVPNLNFDPRMGTVSPAGRVSISDAGGASIQQVVSSMGRVRACKAGKATGSLPACDVPKA